MVLTFPAAGPVTAAAVALPPARGPGVPTPLTCPALPCPCLHLRGCEELSRGAGPPALLPGPESVDSLASQGHLPTKESAQAWVSWAQGRRTPGTPASSLRPQIVKDTAWQDWAQTLSPPPPLSSLATANLALQEATPTIWGQ